MRVRLQRGGSTMRFLALALVAGCHAWLGDAPLPSGVTQTAHSARDILTAPLLYFDEVSVGLSLSPPNRARPR